ncbi:MAG: STAS domain-containing protein [Fibrobacterota bacterium]
MEENNISYAFINETTCLIRLFGAIKYMNVAASFEEFINTLAEKEEVENVVIDMRDCTYIDSTDLGILARIAIYQSKKVYAPQPVIVYRKGSDIQSILEDIGFSRVFRLVDSLEIGDINFQSIENTGMKDELKMAKLMVDAHERLVDVDRKNTEKFGTVINLMKQNLKQLGEDDA